MTTAELVTDDDRLRAAKRAQNEELVRVFADRAALAHDGIPLDKTTPARQDELLRWAAIFVRATDPFLHADAEARSAATDYLRSMEPPITGHRIADHLFDHWQTVMATLDRSET